MDVLRGLSVDELACILPDSFQPSRILSSVQKETRSDELWKLVQNLFLDLLDDDTHTRLLELHAADEICTATSDLVVRLLIRSSWQRSVQARSP